MHYQLIIRAPWPHRDPKRGRQVLPAGTYEVPDQLSPALAELAIAQGMGRKIPPPAPPLELPPAPPALAKPKRRYRRRKGAAPENKLARPADHNKALV